MKTKDLETTSPDAIVLSDDKEQAAQKIIKKYAAIAISAGFVPVPLLDLATLAGIQLKAIHEIGKLHGHDFSENAGKSAITTAISTLSANPVSRIGASLLKVVPVIGGALSTVSFHGYAAASTYAIGNLYHRHFANGGTILDFDPKNAKESYRKLMKKYKSSDDTAAVPATA